MQQVMKSSFGEINVVHLAGRKQNDCSKGIWFQCVAAQTLKQARQPSIKLSQSEAVCHAVVIKPVNTLENLLQLLLTKAMRCSYPLCDTFHSCLCLPTRNLLQRLSLQPIHCSFPRHKNQCSIQCQQFSFLIGITLFWHSMSGCWTGLRALKCHCLNACGIYALCRPIWTNFLRYALSHI